MLFVNLTDELVWKPWLLTNLFSQSRWCEIERFIFIQIVFRWRQSTLFGLSWEMWSFFLDAVAVFYCELVLNISQTCRWQMSPNHALNTTKKHVNLHSKIYSCLDDVSVISYKFSQCFYADKKAFFLSGWCFNFGSSDASTHSSQEHPTLLESEDMGYNYLHTTIQHDCDCGGWWRWITIIRLGWDIKVARIGLKMQEAVGINKVLYFKLKVLPGQDIQKPEIKI